MKKLLWVGDAACPSGFARATHGILDTLHREFDVTVLGINYQGDPYDYPYKIYACPPGGDAFGYGRFIWMCDLVKPDLIVLQNDGWNIPPYMEILRKKLPTGEYAFPEYADVPVVAAVAVDGRNFHGPWLDGVSAAIFWTQFALDEARVGGYMGPATVIPLGVDLKTFYPASQRDARERLAPQLLDKFIVGNVNRNQPRKRLDLTIKYFAEWVMAKKIKDALLYLHVAPTGDTGCSIKQLARYYGVLEYIALREPPMNYGVPEDQMRDTYNIFDVCISTTQGEGMGLPAMEAMACGIPCLLPDWSAYGDWARGAAYLINCTTTAIGPPYVNVIGGIPEEQDFLIALDDLYRDRQDYGQLGFERIREPRFRWENIGRSWAETLHTIVTQHEAAA